MTIDSLKAQLKIDGTAEDAYLTDLISQAQDVTMSAVDSSIPLETFQQYSQFDRACSLLVCAWYFNRLAVSDTQYYESPLSYKMLIQQLRGKLWGADTSGTN